MLEMHMDVIKCKEDNARARMMGFQISRNFEKMRNFRKNPKKENYFFLRRADQGVWGVKEALYESSVRKLG